MWRTLQDDVATNPGAATYNKGIINSYVTELNAYHKPDPDDSQRKYISELIANMKHADSDDVRSSLKTDLNTAIEGLIGDIALTRHNTFVIHNEYTKDVYGVLANNCTTNDRDNYVKSVVNLHEIINDVNQLADTP